MLLDEYNNKKAEEAQKEQERIDEYNRTHLLAANEAADGIIERIKWGFLNGRECDEYLMTKSGFFGGYKLNNHKAKYLRAEKGGALEIIRSGDPYRIPKCSYHYCTTMYKGDYWTNDYHFGSDCCCRDTDGRYYYKIDCICNDTDKAIILDKVYQYIENNNITYLAHYANTDGLVLPETRITRSNIEEVLRHWEDGFRIKKSPYNNAVSLVIFH